MVESFCIDLDAEQSARLIEACGNEFGSVFVVTARKTYPGDPKRWRLWLVPSTARRVNAALRKLTSPEKPSSRQQGPIS